MAGKHSELKAQAVKVEKGILTTEKSMAKNRGKLALLYCEFVEDELYNLLGYTKLSLWCNKHGISRQHVYRMARLGKNHDLIQQHGGFRYGVLALDNMVKELTKLETLETEGKLQAGEANSIMSNVLQAARTQNVKSGELQTRAKLAVVSASSKDKSILDLVLEQIVEVTKAYDTAVKRVGELETKLVRLVEKRDLLQSPLDENGNIVDKATGTVLQEAE